MSFTICVVKNTAFNNAKPVYLSDSSENRQNRLAGTFIKPAYHMLQIIGAVTILASRLEQLVDVFERTA
ncbi:hypothetical protein [Sphingobacterium haloxyli]|uniref:Uncharacterized protein n=1 Tax=Sphingobacterium haloxyli TaxID=2100533 RepID=A0A2S9J3G4_9SPHI|nr:hypothetical protein [Sphingobacterium haloxyli]PRD47336.1 hypothetical protein C5745_10980 [Sphingobacterium haloxyli]